MAGPEHISVVTVDSAPQPFDLTVRVGCSLAYEVTGSASLLLNLQPRLDRNHAVVFEALTLGNDLPAEAFNDTHGNRVWRVKLAPGSNCFRRDAIVATTSRPDNGDLPVVMPALPVELPPSLLRYTLPSRYCDSDKLAQFAWDKFGQVEHGLPRVNAISQWLHDHIEYRHCSGRADLSAWDVLQRGYGVCRDFAHLAVALNRTFNLPARYVTGHLPDIGFPDPANHMDFHAYAEVYIGGHWFTTDARFHVPRIGRIKISCGLDAVDGAFSTIYGAAMLSYFQVWAYQVRRGAVGVGDPLDLSRRLDNRHEVQTETPYSVGGE
jgi:transglutaminase-like putative cysteine protease